MLYITQLYNINIVNFLKSGYLKVASRLSWGTARQVLLMRKQPYLYQHQLSLSTLYSLFKAKPNEVEAKLANGLIKGHAYTVSAIANEVGLQCQCFYVKIEEIFNFDSKKKQRSERKSRVVFTRRRSLAKQSLVYLSMKLCHAGFTLLKLLFKALINYT